MSKFNESVQNESTQSEKSYKLQIWRCDNCSAVHFKAGNVLLNFSRSEFSELTHAMMEIYEQEFGSLEFYDLISLLKQRENVLVSQAVS